MDEIIYVIHTPYGVSHFLHGFLHLVHLLLQVWHHLSSSASRLISSSTLSSAQVPPLLHIDINVASFHGFS